MDVRIRVTGIPQLADGFSDFLRSLAAEMAPGFIPEARYHGEQGQPFTLEKIDLTARQAGFVIRASL